mgnify:CR=1 FL=1
MQNGGLITGAKKVPKQGPIKTIKTIRKAVNKITKFTTPKMQLGGSLPKAQNGGDGPSRKSCGEKIKRRKKAWARQDKAVKILKPIVKATGVIGGIGLAGVAAYKKSTPFKNAVDELKGKLGFNQKGGVVKKYQSRF